MPTDALSIEAAPDPVSGASAPADLPPGRRGLRGRFAAVVALLALAALSTSWWHGQTGGGGGGAGYSVVYSINGWRSWALLVLTLVAGVLLVGAAVLWTARHKWGVLLGGAVVAAALALGAWTVVIGTRFATVSETEFQSTRLGTSRVQLEQRLGAPLTTSASATPSTATPTLACDVYRTVDGSNYPVAVFCFRDGVLALKLHQPNAFVP